MFNVNHWYPSRDGGSSKAEWHSQTTNLCLCTINIWVVWICLIRWWIMWQLRELFTSSGRSVFCHTWWNGILCICPLQQKHFSHKKTRSHTIYVYTHRGTLWPGVGSWTWSAPGSTRSPNWKTAWQKGEGLCRLLQQNCCGRKKETQNAMRGVWGRGTFRLFWSFGPQNKEKKTQLKQKTSVIFIYTSLVHQHFKFCLVAKQNYSAFG